MHVHSEQNAHATPISSLAIGTLEEQEHLLLIRALEAAAGNQSKAAHLMRVGRDALRYKLKKHNLDTPDS